MKKIFKILFAAAALFALSNIGSFIPRVVNVYAAPGYSVSENVDFSMQCGHTDGGKNNLYNVKAEPAQGKLARITMDGNANPSVTRLFYGDDQRPYRVDLRDFESKFTIEQLTQGSSFHIAFMSDQNQYPLLYFGSGVSLHFTDNGLTTGFSVGAYRYPNQNINHHEPVPGASGSLLLNQESQIYIGKEISLKIIEEGSDLDVTISFPDYLSSLSCNFNIAKSVFDSSYTDYTNATLFFATKEIKGTEGAKQDYIFTVNDINEPNTNKYKTDKEQIFDWLDKCVDEFDALDTLDEFKAYIASSPDPASIRKSDLTDIIREKCDIAVSAEEAAITRILSAVDSGGASDFINGIPHNYLGSMSEMEGNSNKLFLLNKAMQSAIAFKNSVSLRDFEMTFSLDTPFSNGRLTFLFASDVGAWDYYNNGYPGIKLTIGFLPSTAWFIVSDAQSYAISGIKVNEWCQVLKPQSNELQEISYRTGDKAVIRFKENTTGDFDLSVTANDTSMNVTIPKTYFTDYDFDSDNVYLKIHSGEELNVFATEVKYVELTVDSVIDANYKALKAAAVEYIEMNVDSIETYLAARAKLAGLNIGGFLFGEPDIKTQFETKHSANIAILKQALTGLAQEYKDAVDALYKRPKTGDIDTVNAKREAFEDYLDLLNDLPVSDRNAILSIYNEAEEAFETAKEGKSGCGGCGGSAPAIPIIVLALMGISLMRKYCFK